MKTYVSLLRGINVGGKNLVNMKQLKTIYEEAGLKNVKTYLQTGNIVFQSDLNSIENIISKAISEHLGLDLTILVYDTSEFEKIIKDNPFSDEKESYITFFQESVSKSLEIKLIEKKAPTEKLFLSAQALFLHCPEGYGKTKMNNNFIEKTLNTNATTRNFNTSRKILEILKETL